MATPGDTFVYNTYDNMSRRPLSPRNETTFPRESMRPTDNVNYEMAQYEQPIQPKQEQTSYPPPHSDLPRHQGQKITKGIRADGESGRRGFHPFKFLQICFRSSCTLSKFVNLLWPIVPIAFAIHYAYKEWELVNFILAYIAIIPAANLIGFAGQELARKLPPVFGVLLETTLGSVVEIILFMIFVSKGEDYVPIIKSAILGSILANLLLCLGLCFFAGGLKREEQEFHEAVSEVGSNLMLVAGMGLVVPAIFNTSLSGEFDVRDKTLKISRATAVVLLLAYAIYVFFQMRSHHGLYEEVLSHDEHQDADRRRDIYKKKLTMTECIVALAIALTVVTFMAYFLVIKIRYIVEERHVKDAFVGLILVPLVEKAAEHITAVDEAWDNQMNFALAHVLGASIQTALFNTPLVVIVSWILDSYTSNHVQMDLNFQIFDAACLILAILVVGNFLRDGKSNYLEGSLCVLVYVIIAIAAFYRPNVETSSGTSEVDSTGEITTEALRRLLKML